MLTTFAVASLVFLLTLWLASVSSRISESNTILIALKFVLFLTGLMALLLSAYILFYTFIVDVSNASSVLNSSMQYEREVLQI